MESLPISVWGAESRKEAEYSLHSLKVGLRFGSKKRGIAREPNNVNVDVVRQNRVGVKGVGGQKCCVGLAVALPVRTPGIGGRRDQTELNLPRNEAVGGQ